MRKPKTQQGFDFGGERPGGQASLFGTTTRRGSAITPNRWPCSSTEPFLLRLHHEPNPDFAEQGPAQVPEYACARSLGDASRIARSFIDRHGLGAGNWTGGQIVKRTSSGVRPVGRVAYNGRIFAGTDPDALDVLYEPER